jgi:hypothetical protein
MGRSRNPTSTWRRLRFPPPHQALRRGASGATFRNWHLVGGELEGRSNVIGGMSLLMVADRITGLAAHTGGPALGYNCLDITADATLTVARGPALLRQVLERQVR